MFKNLRNVAKSNGFTLIELLVVIAIIAILAAILFPVFAQAREKARQASCLSNIKQLATATALYADDYDETLPGVRSWGIGFGINESGYMCSNSTSNPVYCLYPYVKNLHIFCCPSAPNKNDITKIWSYPTETGDSGGSIPVCASSYAYNGTAYNFTALAQIGNPSALMFCCERNVQRSATTTSTQPYMSYIMPSPYTAGGVASTFLNCGILPKWNCQEPHNGGQNVAFCDGHAKYCKTGTLTFRNLGINPPGGYGYDDPLPHSANDLDNYNIMEAGKTFTARYE